MGVSLTEVILATGVFILMIGVGASCETSLFRKLLKAPRARQAAAIGVACQFGIMPFLAYLLTLIFRVDGHTALGFILAGCMPGGSASNVLTQWSHGVLELSVCMTICSNILAFGLTPLCLFVYGTAIGVESALAFRQIATAFAFLVVPLSIGALLSHYKPSLKSRIEQGLGAFAMLVFLLVLILVCLDYPEVLTRASYETIVPALLYFPLAASVSYGITVLCKFPPALRRTITVETCLQNLSIAFAIGELSVRTDEARMALIPFPLFYSIFMYFWMGLLLPLFRFQHRFNIENGIVDTDELLFGIAEEEVATSEDAAKDTRIRAQTDDLSADSSSSSPIDPAYSDEDLEA